MLQNSAHSVRSGLGEEGAWSPAQMAEWFTGEGVLEGVLDEGEKGSGPSEGEVKEGRRSFLGVVGMLFLGIVGREVYPI